MKEALCFLLLILCVNAFAQVEEIPELSSDELQSNWLESFYKELNISKSAIKINSRLRHDGTDLKQLYSLKGSKEGFGIIVNVSNSPDSDLLDNFRISSQSKGWVKELSLGTLNPSWALGAVLKDNGRSQAIFHSGNPLHPEYSSPQGVAISLGHARFSAFGMASQTLRSANVKNGYINTLYKKRNPGRSQIWERLVSGGAEMAYGQLRLGGMVYYQSYELPFANAAMNKDLQAYSFAMQYDTSIMHIECETAIIGKETAIKGIVGLRHASLKQQLGLSVHANEQLPAYSAKPGLLSSQGKHSEIVWNTDYVLSRELDAQLRLAFSRNEGDISLPKWQSRTIFGIRYANPATTTGLQLSRFNKELVTLADSSYISSLPMHYRLKMSISHKIKPKLELGTEFRYHYEDKLSQERNSFYWESRIRRTLKYAYAEIGLRNWQSLYSLAIPDAEMGDNEGLFVLKGEGNQAYLKLRTKWVNFHASSELRFSLDNHKLQWYVNIGI